jgi:2-alkenal reductase
MPVESNSAVAALQNNLEQIYDTVNPTVVNIEVFYDTGNQFTASSASGSLGSGFVWDTRGNIVTNNHVVDDASQIYVTFENGMTVEAELVGADPNSDLAVIRVDIPAEDLFPARIADSDQVRVGQLAVAIGNPYGLAGTMTAGIVSALSRSLPVSSDSALTGGTYTIPDIIQTDAAINPGNSGGVLVNDLGEVIGVTAAIRSSAEANSGIGFVIPANIVSRVVPELIENGSFQHSWMGISGATLTPDLREALGLDADQRGVAVMQVVNGSPAADAGLHGSATGGQTDRLNGGDVIVAVDGVSVNQFEDLTSYLFNHTQVGQAITLTVLRQGEPIDLELALRAMPDNASS